MANGSATSHGSSLNTIFSEAAGWPLQRTTGRYSRLVGYCRRPMKTITIPKKAIPRP
jgi:hypothetical protein